VKTKKNSKVANFSKIAELFSTFLAAQTAQIVDWVFTLGSGGNSEPYGKKFFAVYVQNF
jgi:hypothetical protein